MKDIRSRGGFQLWVDDLYRTPVPRSAGLVLVVYQPHAMVTTGTALEVSAATL